MIPTHFTALLKDGRTIETDDLTLINKMAGDDIQTCTVENKFFAAVLSPLSLKLDRKPSDIIYSAKNGFVAKKPYLSMRVLHQITIPATTERQSISYELGWVSADGTPGYKILISEEGEVKSMEGLS